MDPRRLFGTFLFVFVAVLAFGPPAWAQEDVEEEAMALERRIDVLTEEAEALAEEGKAELAGALFRRVQTLRAQLRVLEARRDVGEARDAAKDAADYALRLLQRLASEPEDRDAIERLAEALREGMEEALDEDDGDEDEEHGGRDEDGDAEEEDGERSAAKRRLDVMRLAHRVLREGEREDAAELMEHAIHALEFALEGRRDREAMEIRRSAPGRGRQIDILELAAELLARWGAEEQAQPVIELARDLARAERRGPELDERRSPAERRRRLQRLKALEEELGELIHAAHRLQRELEALREALR